jgi:biotin synthase
MEEQMNIKILGNEVIQGKQLTREEARWLYSQPFKELCEKADEIRAHFCANGFDICTIINGKSGRCSENCRFCAQSAHNHTGTEEYPLLSTEEILEQAKKNDEQGVLRYSIVTSGKRLSDKEVDRMCDTVRQIRKETGIGVCISFGLLNGEQYKKLKEAGVTRVHNNLETSRRNFPNVCTTHTFEDKISAIRAAQAAGLSVCSGGIMGLGETAEDRIDMAFTLRELGIKSVPVNMLNPIPGTPFEHNRKLTAEDMCRIVAVYRFILPDASIRLAGGRGLLGDKGKSCFQSGANAAISGDMLTTAGITVETDMKLLEELGYEVRYGNE